MHVHITSQDLLREAERSNRAMTWLCRLLGSDGLGKPGTTRPGTTIDVLFLHFLRQHIKTEDLRKIFQW